MRRLIFLTVACGCASQGVPPGGPVDRAAPQVMSITPDTAKTGFNSRAVIFKFDELVAEKPANVTTLADLFVISPRRGAPDVAWKREEIHVRPRGAWLPNTTYTVTMLPGITDLRNNVRNATVSTFFSTGSDIARARINGTVIDWTTATPLRGAVVEARVGKDTTNSWITVADTAGAFSLAHLPNGAYTLRAYVDRNRNFGVDPDEAWDSAAVTLNNTLTIPLLVYVHDTVPPQLREVLAPDSVTLVLMFDHAADSATALSPASYSVVGADSVAVPVTSVRRQPGDTSQHRVPMPRIGPVTNVEMKLARPMVAKRAYRVRAANIRGVTGRTTTSDKVVTYVPVPAIKR